MNLGYSYSLKKYSPLCAHCIIIELTGDPGGLQCSEYLGLADYSQPDVSKGIPVVTFTSCLDESNNIIDLPVDDVYSTNIHEFGHSLGLGHAFNINDDLMCSVDHDTAGNEITTCAEYSLIGR
jgi:hypothetical protein